LEKSHEQSIIDGFFDHFKEIATGRGEQLTRCSTDGHDSVLGGDYILTDNTVFVLTEFKYEAGNIKSERRKDRRLNLCNHLEQDTQRLQQSLKCHYIGWSTKKHNRDVEFNKYYDEVCNKQVFNSSATLLQAAPNFRERVKADGFIDNFLNNKIGASYKLFEVYVNWLLSLEEGGAASVELITRDPRSKTMKMIDFESIYDLKVWLDYNKPKPKSTPPPPSNPFRP
jgi:hypothetical protein